MVSTNVIVGAACAVLVPLVLLLLSLGAVQANEYGLIYNWITKRIGKQVYRGGTHLIGFWNTFVTFPAVVQVIEFSDRYGMRTAEALHTRTKEGLALHLHISFEYLLDPDHIPELYALTNVQYENLFIRIARDELLEAAAEYEGPQYWQDRQNIGRHMRSLVDGKLKESYGSLWDLQLLKIDLPDRYEKSITMTQVQQQIISTRMNQQVAASIRADTDVLKADFDRRIKVVGADAAANFTIVTKSAEAEAAKKKIRTEADALSYVRKTLGLSALGTVEYQQLGAYGMMQNATFLANVPGALPIVSAGGAPPAPPASLLQRGSSWRRQGAGDLAPDSDDDGSVSPGTTAVNAVSKNGDVRDVRPNKTLEDQVHNFFHPVNSKFAIDDSNI
eukprot:gnl/TRDRNA2_/TRDRNA2_83705_c0_seq1.p1 gnl/TRDRNA2_/TRDRNA2_83705_c0~~gnl/TRDRNA2_/TRDRNA2_83705_c0_seq1.p1  ORF type:complete len:389 (-),score=67.83 gnl/TRDRNA2_/TRDRNA2_83705_c0_seq1:89-1255(-)